MIGPAAMNGPRPGIASAPIPSAPLVLTPVEKFPEPEFSQLQRQVFADVQRESGELDAVLRAEAAAETPPGAHPPMHRLGAYIGEELFSDAGLDFELVKVPPGTESQVYVVSIGHGPSAVRITSRSAGWSSTTS